MPFTTIEFIGFFSVLFIAYYALARKFQWWLLLAGSMIFYAYASPFYLLLIWGVILLTWGGGVWMRVLYERRDAWLTANKGTIDRETKKQFKAQVERQTHWVLLGVIAVLLLLLGGFKYLQFICDNIVWLGGILGWHTTSPTLGIILPVGLSFYIFQSMAYCIDVHREEIAAERNLLRHALYVSYFPQIMQGPIGNYSRLGSQLSATHDFNYEEVVSGIQRVTWGFFKKFLIANTIANRINIVWTSPQDYPGMFVWGVFCFLYAVQLYADFSGYMDIACGCSQMLGIKLDENFNCPYLAKSIPDFWRRWHMSLSTWFKDYLFYPILRSNWNAALRKRAGAMVATAVALAVVWLATGLWHGASWGYVAWGAYYGFFMILSLVIQPYCDRFHAAFPKLTGSKVYSVCQMARTFSIVVVGYAIFKPGDFGVTLQIVRQAAKGLLASGSYLPHNGSCSWAFIGVGVLILLIVDVIHYNFGHGIIRATVRRLPLLVRWLCYLTGLWVIVFLGLYGSGFDQFEYFNF